MALTDMKMSKKEIREDAIPSPAGQNPYPYGLRINLDTDELAKLGITAANLPDVGDGFMINARGTVTSVSEDETVGNGYRCSVSIQIEAMELTEDEGADDADELGEAAEATTVHATKTVMHSTYRGR